MVTPRNEGQNGSAPPTPVTPPATVADVEPPAQPPAGYEPSPTAELSAASDQPPVSTTAAESETSEPAPATTPGTSSSDPRGGTAGADESSRSDSDPVRSAAIATDTSAGPVVALLIPLLAIGFFVLRALK